jgi:hypothetical protein
MIQHPLTCMHCGYDLTGIPHAQTCPECDHPILDSAREHERRRSRLTYSELADMHRKLTSVHNALLLIIITFLITRIISSQVAFFSAYFYFVFVLSAVLVANVSMWRSTGPLTRLLMASCVAVVAIEVIRLTSIISIQAILVRTLFLLTSTFASIAILQLLYRWRHLVARVPSLVTERIVFMSLLCVVCTASLATEWLNHMRLVYYNVSFNSLAGILAVGLPAIVSWQGIYICRSSLAIDAPKHYYARM